MLYLAGIVVFLFGAAIGSFVLVVAERYNTGLPFLKGRSMCFSCGTQLSKKDLVPIFSFLFSKGKCRYCKAKIPKKTLFVEIIMGLLSLIAALKSGFLNFFLIHDSYFVIQSGFSWLLLTAIFAVVLLISLYDLKHFIIPNSFLISLFLVSFLYNLLFTIHNSFLISLVKLAGSGIILALPFFLIFLISKGTWFGMGDVKYIFTIGFLLGFAGGISAVVLSFWIGAAFSIIALLSKKIMPHSSLPLLKNNLTIKSEIPFGPFLSLGIIISLYFNADLFQIHSLLSLL